MRYFMHLGSEEDFCSDDEGRKPLDIEAARKEAIAAARDVMAEDVRQGHLDLSFFIAVENEAHELLFRVGFADALTDADRWTVGMAGAAPFAR